MSPLPHVRRPKFLVSGTIVGVAGGLLAGVDPLIAAGASVMIVLFILPWNALFALLSFFAIAQSAKTGGGGVSLNGIVLAGLNFRPAMAVLGVFAIRTLITRAPRNRFKLPEFMLIGYALVLLLSSITRSPDIRRSLPTVGDIWFGVAAYLIVYWAISTADRLRIAARTFLLVILLNALYGILAAVGHLAANTHFGISTLSAYGPGVFGLSFEHDIFASTCGAGAISFYVLWRQPNVLFSTRFSGWAFLLCTLAMFLGLARAAWIGFGVAMILLIITTRRSLPPHARPGRTGAILLTITFGGLILAYVLLATPTGTATNNSSVVAGIKAKFSQLVNVNSGTGRGRVSELRTALSDVKDSPLIGLGANTYGIRHPLESKNNYIGDVWLRALYETGVVGLGLLFGAVALILWPNRTLMSSRLPLATLARALTFGWIVLALAYLGTDDTLYMWPWIMLALVRASRVIADREEGWALSRGAAWLPAVGTASAAGFEPVPTVPTDRPAPATGAPRRQARRPGSPFGG